MPAVQRVSDQNDAGAAIESGVASVRVNNLAISVNGSKVANHAKAKSYDHKSVTTANGIASVRAGNKPVNVTGNADSCSTHKRVGGSKDVRIG